MHPREFLPPGLLGLAILTLTPLAAPCAAAAQIRASEPASVTQTIDGTEITIDYFRPRARGRAPLFGHDGVVWEHIWTPGANWSTALTFEKPITIDGEEVEPGTYSVWMVMSEDEFIPEEMILHPEPRIFHTNPPDLEEAVLRLPITLQEAPHREMLTWDFEEVRTNGATLAFRWGETRIPFEIGVEPSMRQVATDEEAAPILGSYTLSSLGPPSGEEGGSAAISLVITRADDGTIHGDMEGVPEAGPSFLNRVDLMLLPLGERIFGLGEAWDGTLGEVYPGMTLEFDLVDGPSQSFQIRDEDDRVVARGERSR